MENNQSYLDLLLSSRQNASDIFVYNHWNEAEVMSTLCALLNDHGGWIVITADNDKEHKLVAELQRLVVNCICPLPLVYVVEDTYQSKKVVFVSVIKGSQLPYTYAGKCYIRTAEKQISLATTNDLNVLQRHAKMQNVSWEKMPALSVGWEDLDEKRMKDVVEIGLSAGRLTSELSTPEALLSHLSLTGGSSVTMGAVALFAEVPTRVLPQCKVRIQIMFGGKEAGMYEDTRIIEGNAFEVLDRVSDYFVNRLPMVSRFSNTKWDREMNLLYPSEVLDEAVTNAVIHRDYSDMAGEVTIYIYKEKIEIINSGQMPEKMVSGKNKVMPHHSIPRNPQMAEIFHIANKMEKTGRGLGLIASTMDKLGCRLPEWKSKDGYTTLTLYNTVEEVSMNERTMLFMRKMHHGDVFTKVDYLEVVGGEISKPTAQSDIQILLKLKHCSKIGNGPQTKYRIE